jgi:hypothetical protein
MEVGGKEFDRLRHGSLSTQKAAATTATAAHEFNLL